MESGEELSLALKEAIRAQNRRDIVSLTSDPLFLKISSEDLTAALKLAGPIMQEEELLSRFIQHPQFNAISADALATLFLLTIPSGYSSTIQTLLRHPELQHISPKMIDDIILAVLEFQDRRLVSDLYRFPSFKKSFTHHLDGMVRCAIRTQDPVWMKEILTHPEYPQFSEHPFPDLIKWAIGKKDDEIVSLAIRTHHFSQRSETVLRQILIDTFNDGADPIEEAVADELFAHRDYPLFSPVLVGWLLLKTIQYGDKTLFDQLTTHPSYLKIPCNVLAELIVQASQSEKEMINTLLNHPHYLQLSGAELGVILEMLTLENKDQLKHHLKHPDFENVPQDIFKHMPIMGFKTSTPEIRQELLKDPLFKHKYGEMIHESIRRNECDFISQQLDDPLIRKEVLAQLIHYSTTDKYFVSEYTIRDILRVIFLSHDQSLIQEVASNPIFMKRVPELITQSIQFDDEKLIEAFLLNPLLRKEVQEVMKKTSQADRERLYRIFASNLSFGKKPQDFIEEVRSWMKQKFD